MDEPVPVRRAVIGCLTIAVLVGALLLLLRPAVFFTVAPPRDDSAVVVAAVSDVGDVPIARPVVLGRSRGWAGEVDAGDGRAQLTLLVVAPPAGGVAAVNAASPDAGGCAVEVRGDRLVDCQGGTWTFDGSPIDAATALERFPTRIDGDAVIVDLTRTVGD
jgi:hypothetical protein